MNQAYMCDFETTVYEGQTDTEVWAFAIVPICERPEPTDVMVFNSIEPLFDLIESFTEKTILFFHNLKFDGMFILDYVLRHKKYKQAFELNEKGYETWLRNKDMPKKSFRYLISEMGLWYTITFKNKQGQTIEIRDSLKLLPFSVEEIGAAFKTKYRKLKMEYKGIRHAGDTIPQHEVEYIKNDVLVPAEAIYIMFEQGNDKLTIGANAMKHFKQLYFGEYNTLFPPLDEFYLDPKKHTYETAYDWLHRAYRGGWVFANPFFAHKLIGEGKDCDIKDKGQTADVNSLYPSVMHSESGNAYPIGSPRFFMGGIPEGVTPDRFMIFIRFRCRFDLKENKLPFIQIKNNYLYDGRAMLYSSKSYIQKTNTLYDEPVELTMPYFEFEMFQKFYNIKDLEFIDGCYFYQQAGLFDAYINYWAEIKMKSTGALRTLAKLMLNNLYGKFSTSPDSSYQVARIENDVLKFRTIPAKEMKAGYIAIGLCVTAYARRFTITAAQKNYKRFCYADTDSIHCIGREPLKGIKVDPVKFLCWKIESKWDQAYFVRPKTYIEHVEENEEEKEHYIIRCAGLPVNCKNMLEMSIRKYELQEEEKERYTDEEIEFIETERNLRNFDIGLKIPGKLRPKRIRGGVVLEETEFSMRKNQNGRYG